MWVYTTKGKIIEIKRILQSWVKGNGLYPNKVKTIPKDLSEKYMKGKVGFDADRTWLVGLLHCITNEYKSIMAIEHWLEDVV